MQLHIVYLILLDKLFEKQRYNEQNQAHSTNRYEEYKKLIREQ